MHCLTKFEILILFSHSDSRYSRQTQQIAEECKPANWMHLRHRRQYLWAERSSQSALITTHCVPHATMLLQQPRNLANHKAHASHHPLPGFAPLLGVCRRPHRCPPQTTTPHHTRSAHQQHAAQDTAAAEDTPQHTSSTTTIPIAEEDLTQTASRVLQQGNGIARLVEKVLCALNGTSNAQAPMPPTHMDFETQGSCTMQPQAVYAFLACQAEKSLPCIQQWLSSQRCSKWGIVHGTDVSLPHPALPCRRILSQPGLEGNPLEFLKQTEAYWKVCVRHLQTSSAQSHAVCCCATSITSAPHRHASICETLHLCSQQPKSASSSAGKTCERLF